jgi:phenol 2-monooxygenase
LLATYSAERQVIARNLIDFDKEWSSLMAKKPEDFDNPAQLGEFYVRTAEFPAGFMTQYAESILVGDGAHQQLATGFPIGKRFKSAPVVRVADGNPIHLGHHHRADGRWRIYVFADAVPGAPSVVEGWADWMATAADSPVVAHTPAGVDLDSVFDVKVVYPAPFTDIDISLVPQLFLPRTGEFQLIDYEKIYALDPARDIRELRGIDPAGAIVVVRPDQYVAAVLPLGAHHELAAFFAGNLLVRGEVSSPQ